VHDPNRIGHCDVSSFQGKVDFTGGSFNDWRDCAIDSKGTRGAAILLLAAR